MDMPLVVLLVFSERRYRKPAGMIVNVFVTLRAKEHKVVCLMDVCGTGFAPPAWAILVERNDVRHFGKIARGKCDVMCKEIFVASVEFAAPARRNKKDKTDEVRDPTGGAYRGSCVGSGSRFRY